jgi:Auxiliary Activity family 9 (formerly GH61)
MTYMAPCGSVTCDQADSSKLSWFKISQSGYKSPGLWVQQEISTLYHLIVVSKHYDF